MKFHLVLLIIIFPIQNVLAHTCHPEKIKCPIDGNKVEFCVTMSMSVFGNTMDFQKQGAIGSYYEESINSCDKCNFSGYYEDFERDYKEEEKLLIKEVTSKYNKKNLTEYEQCNLAAEIKIALNETNETIANIYLVGSYLARDYKASNDKRIDLQKKAILFFEKGINDGEFTQDLSYSATIYYLIGELYRRTYQFDKAIIHYDRALESRNKEEWLDEIAIKQKEMAIAKNADNDV